MRKVISFINISPNGFVTGAAEEMNWVIIDDEIFRDAIDLTATTDIVLYGRVTYRQLIK